MLRHAVGSHQINDLPWLDARHAFWGVLALSIVMVGGTLAFFWRKDWL